MATTIELQKALIDSLTEQNRMLRERLQEVEQRYERLKQRMRGEREEADTPAPKRVAVSDPPVKKPRKCKNCGQEINGFSCQKLECKMAADKRRKDKVAAAMGYDK